MLVDHTDASRNGCIWIPNGDLLATHQNVATIRLIESIEDRHQCRFPGTIFTDDSVNSAFAHHQIDVLVGMHGAEAFIDTLQFNRNFTHDKLHHKD